MSHLFKFPRWLIIGTLILSFNAGFINALGFSSQIHISLSHATGSVTLLSIQLLDFNGWKTLGAVLAFFLGALSSSIIVGRSSLKFNKRYLYGLGVESAALLCIPFLTSTTAIMWLAAFACGLQNALTSGYSGALLRTTHVTGLITDIAAELGHFFTFSYVHWQKTRLLGALLLSFFIGGIFGQLSFNGLGLQAFFIPALILLCLTLSAIKFYSLHQKVVDFS
jgi:uncharacterized membrane protein YoaK (UPF0700 family)